MSVAAPPPYLLLLYCGCVAGIYLGSRTAESIGLNQWRFAAASIALTAVGLVGARWFHRWRTGHRGGAAVYGGLLTIVPASIPVLAIADLPFGLYWDAAALSMLVGLIATKFGCAMKGCCAGRETSGPFGVASRNAKGEIRKRYPAQLLEAAWAAAIAAMVWRTAGARFAMTLIAYGAGRLVLERIREETVSRGSNDRISSALVVAGSALYAFGNDAW